MKRKVVFKNIRLRFVALLVFLVSAFIAWNWNSFNSTTPSGYIVKLQPQPETISQERDLSLYDLGGEIRDCVNTGPISEKELRACNLSRKRAREFIYTHWQEKKRAYIILEYNSIDNGSEYHVFIEPGKDDNWHIIWRERFSDTERGFSFNISNEITTSVKYKTATSFEDDYPFKVGAKYLVFFDKDGKEAGSL